MESVGSRVMDAEARKSEIAGGAAVGRVFKVVRHFAVLPEDVREQVRAVLEH